MSTPTPTMTLSPPAPKRGRRGRSASAGKRGKSPRRARSASPKPKRIAPKRSAGKLVTRSYVARDRQTGSKVRRTTTVKVFTYFLYDPNVRGANGRPKKIAVVKSRGHHKAALKGASRGMSQVMVRKADSPLVKVFRTSRQTLSPPKVVRRGDRTITFRTKPAAKLTGYFLTPLYVKRSSASFAALSDSALNQQKRVQSPLSAAAKAAQQRRLLAGRNRAAAARGGYKRSTRPGTPRRA
jgi:hypothetical protein